MKKGDDNRPSTPPKQSATAGEATNTAPTAGAPDTEAKKTKQSRASKNKKPLTEAQKRKKKERNERRKKRKKQLEQKIQILRFELGAFLAFLEDEKEDSKQRIENEVLRSIAQTAYSSAKLAVEKITEWVMQDIKQPSRLIPQLLKEHKAIIQEHQKTINGFIKTGQAGIAIATTPGSKTLQCIMYQSSYSSTQEPPLRYFERLHAFYEIIYRHLCDIYPEEQLEEGVRAHMRGLKALLAFSDKYQAIPFSDRYTDFAILHQWLTPFVNRYDGPAAWTTENMLDILQQLYRPEFWGLASKTAAEDFKTPFESSKLLPSVRLVRFLGIMMNSGIKERQFKEKYATVYTQFKKDVKGMLAAMDPTEVSREATAVAASEDRKGPHIDDPNFHRALGQLFPQQAKKPSPSTPDKDKVRRDDRKKLRRRRGKKEEKALPMAPIAAVSYLDGAPKVSHEPATPTKPKERVKTRGTATPQQEALQPAPSTSPRALYIRFIEENFRSPQGLPHHFFDDAVVPNPDIKQLANHHQKTIDKLFDPRKSVTATHTEVVALWKAIGGTVDGEQSGGSHRALVSFTGRKSRFTVPHGAGTRGYGPNLSQFIKAALLEAGHPSTELRAAWTKYQEEQI